MGESRRGLSLEAFANAEVKNEHYNPAILRSHQVIWQDFVKLFRGTNSIQVIWDVDIKMPVDGDKVLQGPQITVSKLLAFLHDRHCSTGIAGITDSAFYARHRIGSGLVGQYIVCCSS